MRYVITENQYNFLVEQWWNDPKHPEWKKYAPTDYEKREQKKATNTLNNLDPHTLLTITQIGTAFIPFVGPFISAGIGLADAGLYWKEGDKKTAGLIGLFSMIPGVGGLASKIGLGKWSAKALGEIGKKISQGKQLTSLEIKVANKIAQYRQLIQSEMTKIGESATIKGGAQAAKSKLATQSKIQGTKNLGKNVAGYGALGYGYDKGYNYLQRNTPKGKVKGEGIDWEFVKNSFGSSGNEEDNKLLSQAWDKGWRPGKIVPQEYQTKSYRTNYNKEVQDIKSLESLLSSVQTKKI